MLDILFVVFLLLAIIFLFLSIESDRAGDHFWAVVSAVIVLALFLVLSIGVMNIHHPYSIYNVSSGEIETGYNVYAELPWLSYLFQGFAIVMAIYVVLMAFDPIIHVFDKMKRWR